MLCKHSVLFLLFMHCSTNNCQIMKHSGWEVHNFILNEMNRLMSHVYLYDLV